MKSYYLILLCVLLVVLVLCMIYAQKKKSEYSKTMIKLIATAFVGALAYAMYTVLPDETMVNLADSIYFWCTDLLCFAMLKFCFVYTDYNEKTIPFERMLKVIILIDGINLMLNSVTGWMFRVVSKTGEYGISHGYTDYFYVPHYLHLTFCYGMIVYAVIRLLYMYVRTSEIKKRKYLAIVIPLVLIIFCNAICVCLRLPLDVSVLLYGVLAMILCYNIFYYQPNSLIEQSNEYILGNTKIGVACFDENSKCIFINRILGESNFIKSSKNKLIDYCISVHKKCEEDGLDEKEWELTRNNNNQDYHYSCDYRLIKDKKGRAAGYFITIDDQTENYKKYMAEKYKATHDSLTGLLNREAFFKQVDERITKEPDTPRYIIVSDIKDFKLINSLYGEEKGNDILRFQASLIKRYQTEGNICGRTTGDKFAMLLDKDKFDKVVFQKAINMIDAYFREEKIVVRYQIGMCDVTGMQGSAQLLYNRAMLTLATIRENYDETFAEYDQNMMDKLLEDKRYINYFDDAIINHQFMMYLQPQMNQQQEMIGTEALVRWEHPDMGFLPPGSFLEVLENAGLIHRLDLEIWNQAAAKLSEWKKRGFENTYISINISAKDFYFFDVYAELVDIVMKYDISPANLKLELTESAVIDDHIDNMVVLEKLRNFGFEIELDDFGSGYSSLNMLKDYNVDVLKIDRLFLRESVNEIKSRVILESVVQLAQKLNMTIIVEGVEEESQFEYLKGIGCDFFQGYYFSKPLPVEKFEELYMQ